MPFYNGEEYIEEAIISIISQTYKNIEIIVVNDSPKNKEAGNLLIELQQKYHFKLVNHNHNMGITKSLVTAFDNSEGEYICSLAQDDLFVPSKTQAQLKYFQDNPSCLWLYGNMEFWAVETNKRTISNVDETLVRIKNQTMMPELYYRNFSLYIQSSMAKREVIEKDVVPLWSNLTGDGWPVHIRLFEKYPERIALMEDPVTIYRLHGKNTVDDNYKMFSLMVPTIVEMCPKHLQRDIIARYLHLVDINPFYLILHNRFFLIRKFFLKLPIKALCFLIPSKKYRVKLRKIYK
ncbi:MAG: glycosyltransferase involved in cell wall biosynthesis [Lentimonas sp.]